MYSCYVYLAWKWTTAGLSVSVWWVWRQAAGVQNHKRSDRTLERAHNLVSLLAAVNLQQQSTSYNKCIHISLNDSDGLERVVWASCKHKHTRAHRHSQEREDEMKHMLVQQGGPAPPPSLPSNFPPFLLKCMYTRLVVSNYALIYSKIGCNEVSTPLPYPLLCLFPLFVWIKLRSSFRSGGDPLCNKQMRWTFRATEFV